MIDWARLLKLQKQQFQNVPVDTTPKTSPITPPRKPQDGDLRIVTYGLDQWCVEEYGYLGHGVAGWSASFVPNAYFYSEVEAEERIREILTQRKFKQDREDQVKARYAANPPRTVPPYKYINGE